MSQLTESQQVRVRELLASLVRIPSVNENQSQADRDQAERRMEEFVEAYLTKRLGMAVERVPLAPGRDNLVGRWSGSRGERSFALQAHMDTVSARNMTVDPFAAEVREGKMWGRGTCDTKGSMAAFLTALEIGKELGWAYRDQVLFVATCAEETGCKGAEALAASGFAVDAMVVGEPTRCQLVTAHKGTYWARLETKGKSCHAALPHLGRNAIYAMGKALHFIEGTYIPRLSKEQHPLLGSPTLSVGRIEGGVATNIVPKSCWAELDFRVLPGREPAHAGRDFLSALIEHVPEEEFDLIEIHGQPGVEAPSDAPWVRALLDVCREKGNQTGPAGVNYYADSGPLSAAGITCVLFGPGDIAQAHTAAEFVELDQLYLATETALGWLEKATRGSLVS